MCCISFFFSFMKKFKLKKLSFRKMINRLRKFDYRMQKFLNNHKIYFDTLLKIILSVISIILVLQGNKLLEKQIISEGQEVSPGFYFLKTVDNNNFPIYHLYNDKGYTSNVKFEKYNIIEIITENFSYEIEIHVFSHSYKIEDNHWVFKPNYDDKTFDNLGDNIKKLATNKGIIVKDVFVRNYYEISYLDYQNQYYKYHYSVSENGQGDYLFNYDYSCDGGIFRFCSYANFGSLSFDSSYLAERLMDNLELYNQGFISK